MARTEIERKRLGLCLNCGQPVVKKLRGKGFGVYCQFHAELNRSKTAKRYRELLFRKATEKAHEDSWAPWYQFARGDRRGR
jgi:hypothetical protein